MILLDQQKMYRKRKKKEEEKGLQTWWLLKSVWLRLKTPNKIMKHKIEQRPSFAYVNLNPINWSWMREITHFCISINKFPPENLFISIWVWHKHTYKVTLLWDFIFLINNNFWILNLCFSLSPLERKKSWCSQQKKNKRLIFRTHSVYTLMDLDAHWFISI